MDGWVAVCKGVKTRSDKTEEKRRKRSFIFIQEEEGDPAVEAGPDVVEIAAPPSLERACSKAKERRQGPSHSTELRRRRRNTKPRRAPTPPHVTHVWAEEEEEEEEEDDDDSKREEREMEEGGELYYCGQLEAPPSASSSSSSSCPREKVEGLSLADLEGASKAEGEGLLAWPDCAICLNRPTGREGAVVENCRHSFCFVCIVHWASLARVCPLCKQRFGAILHDVRLLPGPAARLSFRRLCLSPEAKGGPPAAASASESSQRAPLPQTPCSEGDEERRRRVYAGRLRAVPPAAVLDENCALELAFARRLPPEVANNEAWKSRLRPWVVRELRSVLEEDDVELLALMVRSCLQDFARQTQSLRRSQKPPASSAGRTRGAPLAAPPTGATGRAWPTPEAREKGEGEERAAREAWEGCLRVRLEEFLVGDTDTFLHELFCFAASPSRTVAVYDASLRYSPTN